MTRWRTNHLFRAGIVCIAVDSAAVAISSRGETSEKCHPGDYLIGEDSRFIYCSKMTCGQLETQLEQDKHALRREQATILATSNELKGWTAANQKAQAAALLEAKRALRDAVLGFLEDWRAGKLDKLEAEFRKRAPLGETWNTKLKKVQDFRSRAARLNGQIDGLKLSQYPISNIKDATDDVQRWARETNREVDRLMDEFQQLNADPEGHAIFVEIGAKFSVDSLKLVLDPLLARTFDFASFLVNYGYDAMAWDKSRARIVQNVENESLHLRAVCKLSEQLKATLRDVAICHGGYPDPSQPVPDPAKCQ